MPRSISQVLETFAPVTSLGTADVPTSSRTTWSACAVSNDEASVRSGLLLDRVSGGLVALVFAATTAISAQVMWWIWHPVRELDDRSTWDLLYAVVFLVGQTAWVRWLLVLGAAIVALATLGVVLQRAWGFLLALPCSASLIACSLLARYAAIFDEPRQYVSRSAYVRTATVVALITVASHGVAALLGTRLLRRKPLPFALARIVLGALAALVAAVPGLWLAEHMPGGARNAVMVCACAVAALAALITCGLPRRGVALASIGASLTTLAVLAVGVVLHLHDRPRRGHLYSAAAEQAIAEVAIAAPLVLALLGVCIALRRHLAMNPPKYPSSSQPPTLSA
jgi:hypothetical protein